MLKLLKHAHNILRSKFRDWGLHKSRSPHWRTIEKEFLSEHPKCAICGSKTRLNVHHKKPFHLFPQLELEKSNLVTLCMSRKECHFLIGHGGNFKNYFPHIDKYITEIQENKMTYKELVEIAKLKAI